MSINLQVETPTGEAGRQLGSGLADLSLNGILQKSLTELTKLRLNGGVLFSGNTLTGVIGIRTRGVVFYGWDIAGAPVHAPPRPGRRSHRRHDAQL